MSWSIFFLRDKISVDMPIAEAIEYVRHRSGVGKRFKLVKFYTFEAKGLYSYSDTFRNRMGYGMAFQNELRIIRDPLSPDSKTRVEFRIPRQRIILNTVVVIFLLSFMSIAFPDIGFLLPAIILLTLYLGIVVGLRSQFDYLKWELEQMEENFKRNTNKKLTGDSASR